MAQKAQKYKETLALNFEKIEKDLSKLNGREYQQLVSSAINETMRVAFKSVPREVSQETKIPEMIVKERFFVLKSRIRRHFSVVSALSNDVMAIMLAPRVIEKWGIEIYGGQRFESAFIAKNPKKRSMFKELVYRRKGKARYPIEAVRVSMFDSMEENFLAAMNKSERIFSKILEKRLRKFIRDKL